MFAPLASSLVRDHRKATAKACAGSLAQHLRPEGGLFWVPLGEHLVW